MTLKFYKQHTTQNKLYQIVVYTKRNPAAFPAQPQEPFIPIAVIIMAVIVLIKGGGNWSLDLKTTE
ncbi:MAG: hypothetical protein IH852_14130 [Bacteroidetes bacterium]|nr:hypothetical protein [Bacteroidota bacterium]